MDFISPVEFVLHFRVRWLDSKFQWDFLVHILGAEFLHEVRDIPLTSLGLGESGSK